MKIWNRWIRDVDRHAATPVAADEIKLHPRLVPGHVLVRRKSGKTEIVWLKKDVL